MKLSSGDRFEGEVKLTKSGTGSVNVDSDTITVGPLTCEKGEVVQFKYLGSRKKGSFEMQYAICLSEHAIDREKYNEYLGRIVDLLTPDGAPSEGERTYVEVTNVSVDGIGYAEPGGKRIELGPINAREGDFVQVEGYSETHARVVDNELKGPRYDLRYWVLSGQHNKLPISTGEEHTTAIAEFDEETPICYVKEVPVSLPGCEGKLGQKLDVRIDRFEGSAVVGEVIELYEEVSRINNSGHWARMQWLKEVGYDEPTFQRIVAEYTGVQIDRLPDDPEHLKRVLVGEAVRLCLADKSSESSDAYPRAHLTGIRHWVTNKLEPILGESDNEDNGWFRAYLDEGEGPTLTFLGDVIKLSHGYYAAGQTRAVMIDSERAIVISGTPTREYIDAGFDVEFSGISRTLVGVSREELQAHDIAIQDQDDYTADTIDSSADDFLTAFINQRESTEWQATTEWEAYTVEDGIQLRWSNAPTEIEDNAGRHISLWREPIEYGGDEYYLRVVEDDVTNSIRVPHRFLKHVALAIDAAFGRSQTIEISPLPTGDSLQLASSFSPPKAQYRWLTAIGASWRGFQNNRINWEIPTHSADSVIQSFEQLPVQFIDNRTRETLQ